MKKLILVVFALFSTSLGAEDAKLMSLLNGIQQDSAKATAAIKAGDQRALLCKYCHGADGNSIKPSIPNLAGQNTAYLIRQFELFASGARNNKTMNELAKILSTEDKVNIALFYASQNVKPQSPHKPELVAEGQRLFTSRCFMCHGMDGHGKADMPRIASQPAEYLVRTLSSYNSSLIKRAETPMTAIARTLTDQDIDALAAYLSAMQ